MENNALLWLGLNVASLIMLSFYTMMEMACVSFNKVRLQYYVSVGDTHALKLNHLLHKPSRLFGTTLIGVNVATTFGSEFSRQFHAALGVSPDWAPLSQVMIVIIFGELAPIFAARRYAESTALLGINLLYASAKLMTPFLWAIQLITHLAHYIVGKGRIASSSIFLSQEELLKILEETDETKPARSSGEEFNFVVSNIFNLRHKTAKQVMVPLRYVPKVSGKDTIGQVKGILEKYSDLALLPVYHKDPKNIIGIAFPRDLVRDTDNRRISDHVRQPWFITQNSAIMPILEQFRRNKQDVAIVLNEKGQGVGILSLDDIIKEIFGPPVLMTSRPKEAQPFFIDRTFPGDTKIEEFNQLYNATLQGEKAETLGELLYEMIGHHPEEGESIYLPPFELIVKEASLLEIKSVRITTKR